MWRFLTLLVFLPLNLGAQQLGGTLDCGGQPYMYWIHLEAVTTASAPAELRVYGDLSPGPCAEDGQWREPEKALNGVYQLELELRQEQGRFRDLKFIQRTAIKNWAYAYDPELPSRKHDFELIMPLKKHRMNSGVMYQFTIELKRLRFKGLLSDFHYQNYRPFRFTMLATDKPGEYRLVRVYF